MNKLRISIPLEENNIHIIEDFIESIITTFYLPSKLLGRINVSVIQAFNNAVYDSNGDITKMVTMVAEKINNQLKITVIDDDDYEEEEEGLDDENISDSTSLKYADKKCEHGLFLIKELSDELIFENNGTMVIMIFYLELNFCSKLLNYIGSIKLGKLIKRKASQPIKQLDISIPPKLNHVVEVENFAHELPNQLDLHGLLFYRIKVVILEMVSHIVTVNRRKDRDIKVVVAKMKKIIKVTISCGEEADTHRFCSPLPSHKLDLQVRFSLHLLYFINYFPDKIAFSKDGTKIIFFFRSSMKAKKNKRIKL